MLLRKSRRAHLLFLLFILCADAHAGRLLVSNASVGEKIYVLYEGEALRNESIAVRPPLGGRFEVELVENAAHFNASEEGRWGIAFRGENYAAFVAGEGGEGAAPAENGGRGGVVLLLLMLLLFACAFAFAAALWRNAGKGEVEFSTKDGKLVLRSVHGLEEPVISDAEGKVLWAAKAFDRAGRLEISLLEMKAPFCLRARMHGEEICILSNGKGGEKTQSKKMHWDGGENGEGIGWQKKNGGEELHEGAGTDIAIKKRLERITS